MMRDMKGGEYRRVEVLTGPGRRRVWDEATKARVAAVEFAILEWVDWYNNRRLLEPIGNIPPAEAEARYYAQLEVPAMAA